MSNEVETYNFKKTEPSFSCFALLMKLKLRFIDRCKCSLNTFRLFVQKWPLTLNEAEKEENEGEGGL